MRRLRSPIPLSPDSPVSPVLWYAVLGAAVAWALQFGAGYWFTEAKCSVAGQHWGIAVRAWVLGIGIAALLVALGSGATAVALYLRTRDAEEDDAPPPGRIQFLAVVGIAVCPLFVAMIAMTTAGLLALYPCTQS